MRHQCGVLQNNDEHGPRVLVVGLDRERFLQPLDFRALDSDRPAKANVAEASITHEMLDRSHAKSKLMGRFLLCQKRGTFFGSE
jgi:hypothetical protein